MTLNVQMVFADYLENCISQSLHTGGAIAQLVRPLTVTSEVPGLSLGNTPVSLLGALSRRSLWSDHSVSVPVEDEPAPPWLH